MADNQFINFNSQDVADMYRRNQYARMLQDQAAAPIERSSYKGIEADIHPMQGVAKLTAALLAGYQQNRMDKSYANEKAAAEQKVVAEQERRKAEVEQYRMGEEPTLSYGPSGGAGDYGTPPTISTAKTPGQLLAHRLNALGSETESVRNMAKASIEQQNAVDQNTAKTAEREAEIKRLQGNADREYKLDVARMGQDRNKQPTAPAGYRYKPNGEQEPIPGGPADVKQSAEFLKKKADANDVLSLLDRADVLLPNSTGSVIGTGVDAAAGAFGYATPGAKAAQQLKMLQGALIARMPKMSGPQSDKDVELYRQQVGEIGNSNLPIETRQSASLGLRQLQEKYADAPASRTPATTAPATTNKGATVSNWNK